jgi:hypothetical protein
MRERLQVRADRRLAGGLILIKIGTVYWYGMVDDVWNKREIYYKADMTSTSSRLAAYSHQKDDTKETEGDKE